MPSEENMHGGHRERLKDRFINEGLDGFQEHNVLELLLFFVIPQKDTNEIAHALLNAFGSLEGVFSASVEDLIKVDGVARHTAQYLSMCKDLMTAYLEDRRKHATIEGISNIVDFAVKQLAFSKIECLMICLIDNKKSMINWYYLREGYVSLDTVEQKDVMRMVMGTNATYAILARNYIKKDTRFRKDDYEILKELAITLHSVGVGLLDYIVIGSDHSFKALSDTTDPDPNNIYLS